MGTLSPHVNCNSGTCSACRGRENVTRVFLLVIRLGGHGAVCERERFRMALFATALVTAETRGERRSRTALAPSHGGHQPLAYLCVSHVANFSFGGLDREGLSA